MIKYQYMNQKIKQYCKLLELEFQQIKKDRKKLLSELSEYISKKHNVSEVPQIMVMCTHNSRRSHIGQLLFSLGADYYKLPQIQTFSSGTEATAFNERAVKAMRKVGFDIYTKNEMDANPVYEIKWRDDMSPCLAFSKNLHHPTIPKEKFAAILVCSEADKGCPVISGCDFRLALPFDDPKAFDGTELEEAKYDERCRDIGREMFYVLSRVGEVNKRMHE